MTFRHLQEITTDRNEIIAAIKDQSELVELSDDQESVRRRRDKPEGEHDQVLADYKRRSVFIGNFPRYTTFDEIKNDYLALYGNIPSFVMRRAKSNQSFRGSIFATFETEELAREFLENPAAEDFYGVALERQMQLDYEKNRPPRTSGSSLLSSFISSVIHYDIPYDI
uniref:RRM domain-containing protein n=1 Tax=Panagrolaimus superbus TaxID=310955 RepID=A0A914YB38_9BILA